MRFRCFFLLPVFILINIAFTYAQKLIVINDPFKIPLPQLQRAEIGNAVEEESLPKVRAYWKDNDICTEEFEAKGSVNGAFLKPDSSQTIVFYQFCITGNGFANNALAVIENGKVIKNFVSEGGWGLAIEKLADINKNGIDELAISYSGGMHQGEGGSGIDILEFSGNTIKGIGWLLADSYNDRSSYANKIWAKPGKPPTFMRQEYVSGKSGKLRKLGRIKPLKLKKIACGFKALN